MGMKKLCCLVTVFFIGLQILGDYPVASIGNGLGANDVEIFFEGEIVE